MKKKSQSSPPYFDNCPICEAMRDAEKHGKSLSAAELHDAFNRANSRDSKTYVLEIRLMHTKNISRTIAVPSSLSLYQLAEAIVGAYKFDFDHAFGFFSTVGDDYYKSESSYELFTDMVAEGEDIEPTGAGSVKTTYLNEVWEKQGDRMLFLFDYGDNWQFSVTLVAIGNKGPSSPKPLLLKSEGRAPKQY